MWKALTTPPKAGTSATGPERFASVPWDTHLREQHGKGTYTDDQFNFGLALTAPVNTAGRYQIQAAARAMATAMQTAAAPTRQLSAAPESWHGQHVPVLDAK